MPTRKYALAAGEARRLVVSWEGRWKNLVVRLDETEVLSVATMKDLIRGRRAALPDGRKLRVSLQKNGMSNELHLDVDGRAVPDSPGDPLAKLRAAYWFIYLVSALTVILAVVAMVSDVTALRTAGIGWRGLVEAAVFALLGFLVQRFRSAIALGFAAALYAVETVVGVVQFGAPPVGALIRIYFIAMMCGGFSAISRLRAEERADAAAVATPPR